MLSIYNNNYSKTSLLLTNNFIIGFSPDEKITIKLPIFDDLINNDSYTIALNLVFNEKN